MSIASEKIRTEKRGTMEASKSKWRMSKDVSFLLIMEINKLILGHFQCILCIFKSLSILEDWF